MGTYVGQWNGEQREFRTIDCGRCGTEVVLFPQFTLYCTKCDAQYNSSGQRLRDDWQSNPSAWDEDVSDMDGFEASQRDY